MLEKIFSHFKSNSNNSSSKETSSSNKYKWYSNFKYVSVAIFSGSTLCFGSYWFFASLENDYYAKAFPTFLLKEIGIAGYIALILNLSIEWVNRRKHDDHQKKLLEELDRKYLESSSELTDKVSQELFKTVYKRNIDPSCFDQVEKHLLKQDIMRSEYSISISLREVEVSGVKKVLMHFFMSYTVLNISLDSSSDAKLISATVDMSTNSDEYNKFIRLEVDEKKYENADLEKLVTSIPEHKQKLLVLGGKIEPKQKVKVSLEYKKLLPLEHCEVMCNTVPMDGIKLQVIDPERKFVTLAISLHPEDAVLTSTEHRQDLKEWSLNHGILPGQGIMLIWLPITNATN